MTTKIKLQNVRLSFPSLFKESEFNGQKGKFEATFLLPKSDEETKAKIDKAIKEALEEANVKVTKSNFFIKDGDEIYEEKEYDGYEDHWAIKASTKKRPPVIGRDKSLITEEDNVIYGGCYVNAVIDLWVQNNQYGKRVNANLYGVQFVKDGEPFGSSGIDIENEFDDLDVI